MMTRRDANTPAAPATLRMTRPRKVVLRVLRGLRSHPTADELYVKVRRRLPNVSLATVYRNLDVLSRAGLVRTLELGGGQRRYDGVCGNHDHVRCARCGRVADVDIGSHARLDAAARSASAFEILGHRLEFVGLCPRCRPRRGKPAANPTPADTTRST
jgi:Fur family ferric uptake transcriptional regulator